MQASRILQQRAVAQLVKTASRNGLLFKAAAARVPAVPSTSPVLSRTVTTQATSNAEALEILNKQRAVRPSSPHFTIYEPQLSWLSSIANRVTGSALSGGLYAFAIAYVAGPALGLGFDGASIISLVASWPAWLKISGKLLVGAPFWYHTWNGLRHLSWDMGYLLSLKSSWTAGYVVIATTAVTTLATAFLL